MASIDHSLFSVSQHALENAYGRCSECDSPLVIKHSKTGPFIGCSAYPTCHFTKPLHEHTSSLVKVIEDSHCPLCQHPLAIKKGRYGLFIGCTDFPTCHHIESTSSSSETHVSCPSCHTGQLKSRTSKFGKPFFACDQFPRCRYLVNSEPVDQACPSCQWPIMVKRTVSGKAMLVCPQKQCQHKLAQATA